MSNDWILSILLVVVIVLLIGMFVWNVTLVSRTMTTTDNYSALVLRCVNDAMEGDAHEEPTFAALRTQAAITRLETTSAFAGGTTQLARTTHVDIEKLNMLLETQRQQIQSFLPTNKTNPFLQLQT